MKQIAFKLQIFEGPLDLLLHLINKNKVSIYDIPISEITEQYMDYIAEMDHYDIEVSSEFLVLAATLLYIKSKMILPKDENDDEEEDPRLELTARLEEYKRMKMAAQYLREREFTGGNMFFKTREYIEPVLIDESLKQITLESLKDAAEQVAYIINRKKPVSVNNFSGIVGRERVSVFSKVQYFVKKFLNKKKILFKELFLNIKSKDEAVASFLAVLELIKMNKIKLKDKGKDLEVTYIGKGEIDENELEYKQN
ncbi:MAG: segregation/condensation protein A [Clostridia bacterium]|nr:segregation/condensation protein A [Clostridia bacterium]